jgi:Homeodomain-like domain
MAEYPKQWPTYRFYSDGRAIVVQNQTEFDALEAGHSDSPAGPFEQPEPPEPGPEMPVGVAETPPDAAGLTAELAQEHVRARARALREEGKSQHDIAHQLGVSRTTVRRLLGLP